MNLIAELSRRWRESGVSEGDTLLLHSATTRTLRWIKERGGPVHPSVILDSVLAVLGAGGTLLLPLFNFAFTRGVGFDIRTTPSEMGLLTEVGRGRDDAVRSGHPIYSFAIIGKDRERYRVDNFSGYGKDSPFGVLHRTAGKIAVLDLPDQNSMTFYHYVEETLNVDYRFHKTFSAPYTDAQGVTSTRTYGLFVRDLDRGVRTHVDPMGERLWQLGLYRGSRPKEGTGMRVISAPAMFDAVAEVITTGKARGLLYELG